MISRTIPSLYAASTITPFNHDGVIDEQALRDQVCRLADEGLAVWLVSSGMAEANTLSEPEMAHIAQIAVGEVGGRTPIVAMGPEPKTAASSIAFARRMADCGVDAVQIGPLDPGHSYMPSEAELRAFFLEVLDAVEAPSYLATHMSVGYNAPTGLFGELSGANHVCGIIATQLREYAYTPLLLQAVDGRVPVLLGSPIHLLEGLALGADGVVSSFDINVAPHLYRAFGDAWTRGDHAAINAHYSQLVRLFLRILGDGGLVIAKAILDRLGLAAGAVRAPRRPPDDFVIRRADQIIEEFELRR